MKVILFLFMMAILGSCASQKKKPPFKKEKVCSQESLRYLQNPRNFSKRALRNPDLISDMAATQKSMQQCYEDFKNRTGHEEFNTCLVIGVDEKRRTEFYSFSSQDVRIDENFLRCAVNITRSVPYGLYGRNYILIQSYQFYYN